MKLCFRHYYWRWFKNLVFLMGLFTILMTIARVSFAFYFGDLHLFNQSPGELRKAFWLGFRFDLMPLAYVNILPFILLNLAFLLPGKRVIRSTRFLIVLILCLGYYLIGWLYVFDYGFYSYFQEHLNILVFGFFEDDTQAILISIYKNYNLLLWIFVGFFLHYGLYRLIKFLFSPFDFDIKARPLTWQMPVTLLSGLALLGLMARGNYSRLPLSVEDAFISENEFINEIALNGALTLNRAIKIRKNYGKDQHNYLSEYGFQTWHDAFEAYQGKKNDNENIVKALTVKTKNNLILKENPPHVVLVVMESFGSYWNDHDFQNFQLLGELKNHFKQGYLFNNFLPSENGTNGSIVSIATSQVIRPGARYLSESNYMQTPLSSAGHLAFQANGYETHFVYGGKLGWRDLGKYLSIQNYDFLWGADEIKEVMPELNHFFPDDLGNEWGIFDEYLYGFIEEQLRTATKPQFFLVLTTSNHPPFEYPSSYRPLPLVLDENILSKITIDAQLAKKRFIGFQYANQKMGEFLTKIKESSLSNNTIVALTGDHSFWIAKGVGLEHEFKRYAVPFFLSIPERYRPAKFDPKKFGSHEDIFPTLINLSLSNHSYVKTGEDMFSDASFAQNSSGLVANDLGAFHHDRYWKWKDMDQQILEPVDMAPELVNLKRKGQGLIGLIDVFLKNEKQHTKHAVKNDRP